jgi:hypothetical protein
VPFDDPNTHLELTMIHEVMVLDHNGRVRRRSLRERGEALRVRRPGRAPAKFRSSRVRRLTQPHRSERFSPLNRHRRDRSGMAASASFASRCFSHGEPRRGVRSGLVLR